MKFAKTWTERFLMALAAGLVAGESLADVATVLVTIHFLNYCRQRPTKILNDYYGLAVVSHLGLTQPLRSPQTQTGHSVAARANI